MGGCNNKTLNASSTDIFKFISDDVTRVKVKKMTQYNVVDGSLF